MIEKFVVNYTLLFVKAQFWHKFILLLFKVFAYIATERLIIMMIRLIYVTLILWVYKMFLLQNLRQQEL